MKSAAMVAATIVVGIPVIHWWSLLVRYIARGLFEEEDDEEDEEEGEE